MSTFYYITRSYPTSSKTTGGEQMRAAAVKFLKEHFNVWVVFPILNADSDNIIIDEEKQTIAIPIRYNLKFYSHLEGMGIVEDYLDKWVSVAYTELKRRVSRKDILWATSGGELGTIKLASKLKATLGCTFPHVKKSKLITFLSGKV